MCTNYAPTRRELIDSFVPLERSSDGFWKDDVYRDYDGPVIRAGDDGKFELIIGTYGLLPKSHMPAGTNFSTMNARAETIGEKRAYSKAWRECHTCLLPTQLFYEPNYESGKAERWAIGMADDEPFCIAGIWRAWKEEGGEISHSFTQITVNAEDHPLMKRFHKPGDEKRSVVIVPKSDYEDWLSCSDPEFARAMLNLYPAEQMKAWPAAKGYGHKKQESTML
jgi:putative SOS response-associated peptidase YedK